eukprot:4983832-Pleurochrysis_carterae.AAC.1
MLLNSKAAVAAGAIISGGDLLSPRVSEIPARASSNVDAHFVTCGPVCFVNLNPLFCQSRTGMVPIHQALPILLLAIPICVVIERLRGQRGLGVLSTLILALLFSLISTNSSQAQSPLLEHRTGSPSVRSLQLCRSEVSGRCAIVLRECKASVSQLVFTHEPSHTLEDHGIYSPVSVLHALLFIVWLPRRGDLPLPSPPYPPVLPFFLPFSLPC